MARKILSLNLWSLCVLKTHFSAIFRNLNSHEKPDTVSTEAPCRKEQAGTGPSQRHIQGSKIAKGLPSVNLQYSKIEKPKKWTE